MQKYPDAKVISLGIGDTTEPIPRVITAAMEEVFFFASLETVTSEQVECDAGFVHICRIYITELVSLRVIELF